jgi:hypothetical protein
MTMKQLVKHAVTRALASQGYSLGRINELARLADLYGSDKGTRMSGHCYTRVYEQLFRPLRYERLVFVEIGLLRVDIDARRVGNGAEGTAAIEAGRAPSLEMWRDYFPNAEIFGFDIDDFSRVRMERCTILRGDMSSPADLERLARTIGRPIDVLIEDGSHVSHHQQIALGALFPRVKSKGMYVVEDLHWQDARVEKAGAPKTRDILRKLAVNRVFDSPFISEEQRKYITDNVEKVSLFDSLTCEVSDTSDALAVLVKK